MGVSCHILYILYSTYSSSLVLGFNKLDSYFEEIGFSVFDISLLSRSRLFSGIESTNTGQNRLCVSDLNTQGMQNGESLHSLQYVTFGSPVLYCFYRTFLQLSRASAQK